MKNRNTKYNNTNITLTLIVVMLLASIIYFLVYSLFHATSIFELLGSLIFLLFFIIGIMGSCIGLIKGKSQVARENRYIKNNNPYIFFRELPNDFGIGVNTLLIDSTIENRKDIVAVILDLCAKKYITLTKDNNKYIIKLIKSDDDNLLNNEKYILSLIKENDIKNVDYQKWFKYCIEDGINLGLYNQEKINIDSKPFLTQDVKKRRWKIHLLLSLICGIIVFILLIPNNALKAFEYGLFCFGLTYILLIVPFYIVNILTGFKNIAKQNKDINYKNIRENSLVKTNKGIEELYKLNSFKAFIKDFNTFVDKNPEEVFIWDRYLSYAQIFGLTKEIMKSGYSQLINNSSFQIDNIDNVDLHNIKAGSE